MHGTIDLESDINKGSSEHFMDNMAICFWNQSDSSSCLARKLRDSNKMGSHPTWSMSSLMTVLPEPPSSKCSQASTPFQSYSHTTNYSDYATEFSTPRNQRQSSVITCDIDNNKNSSCFSEIDEWLEHANKFCKSSNHLTESVNSRRNVSIEEDSRLSAICNPYFAAPEHELYNITLPSIREESPVFQGQTRLSCIYRTPIFGSHERARQISRHRPYDEFLDELRRKKQEAERDARKKTKHVELMNRMRRKENAINDWELWQTRKAMDKMYKIQNELERKQLRATTRTQKKIWLVREKAEKLKLKLRRSIMKRFQQMQISESCSF